jgi:DNA segregation ATPase FtsK/SpoIIIE-like protein
MGMYEKLSELTKTTADFEIPIQQGTIWNLRSAPHCILSANTGFGKSYFTMYLLMMFSIKNNVLFLADPKRSDMASLSNFMPTDRVAYMTDDICKMVSDVIDIMYKRYDYMMLERSKKELFQADFADFEMPIVLLVIEEMAAFVSSLEKKKKEKFEADIKSITTQGRQAGVMLISIMQSPNANNITTESRSQMGLRVFLGNSGGIEYRMIFGEGYSYSKRVYKPGQGLYMLSGKTIQPEIIETPRLDKKQLSETLRLALETQFNVNPLPIVNG